MARYKPRDRHLSKLLPVSFEEQILPGTFEHALNWLIDHQVDRSGPTSLDRFLNKVSEVLPG